MHVVGMPVEKSENFGLTARRLMGLMAGEKILVGIILLLAVVSVALVVSGPRVLGHATDILFNGLTKRNGETEVNFSALHRTLFFAIAVYVLSFLLAYAQTFMLAGVVQRTMFTLRAEIEAKIHRLPLRYIDAKSRGDLLSRVTNDIDNISQSLQQSLSQLITSMLTIIGVLVMMVWVSWLLALIAIITVPLSILSMKQIANRSKKRFIAQWSHTGALNGLIEETFTGHAIVKTFGRQKDVEERFAVTNEKLYEAGFGAQFMSGSIQPAMMFVGNINYVLIAVVGGLRVASGTMGLGDVQAFIQYSRQFTQPLTQTASMMNVLQSGVASAERVFEVIDADEESEDPAEVSMPEVVGRVAFEHVQFSYLPERPLIEDLSLVAEPGTTVAIVLMPRRELRQNIGMVLQDTWLFGGTIRENIAYGNPSATEEQIRAAAKAAYVDRFVHSLPLGYDTVLDNEGGAVSAGEKQLLTIARAFLADPTILILDEATSSVDTRTEVLIQKAMVALRSQRTCFVIAHRLSTIRDANVILVMESGRIVEQGNHDELLAAQGAYYHLYQSQFTGAATDLA
jgi:ATP-binding cassette subfamily B protein